MPNRGIQKQKLRLKATKGHIKTPKSVKTTDIKQADIVQRVDITNASKHFELKLDSLGPYRCKYYKNGRYLLLGGYKGHVAAIDWLTKDLVCEFNTRESIHAVQWLHMPSMFAVAQKDWVHIYDKDAIEINVIKTMYRSIHLDFLEHYFLLASASDKGYVAWKDISIGKDVASYQTKGKISSMTHNSHNGMLYCGHPNGTVSMWSPNYNRAAASILCHPAGIRDVTVSSDGKYYATSSIDRTLRIWDVRHDFRCLKQHKLNQVPDKLHFSQQGILAASSGNIVTMYKKVCTEGIALEPYLRHNVGHIVSDVYFCNYEDVLGVGHEAGFTSLLVPESGEPNFDSHEANPFMSKRQQQEMEVRMLLDKVPHEMICLDPQSLTKTLLK